MLFRRIPDVATPVKGILIKLGIHLTQVTGAASILWGAPLVRDLVRLERPRPAFRAGPRGHPVSKR